MNNTSGLDTPHLAEPGATARSGEAADSQRTPWLLLAAILLLALGARAWGLTFGLPYNYHFDEHIHMVLAYTLSTESPIFPNFGVLQAVVIAGHWLLGIVEPVIGSLWSSNPRIAATLDSPSMSYHLVARWISALAGALTVVPIYFLGRKLWNRNVGIAASLLLAVAYLHVRTSHFGVQNALAAFFVVMSALCSAHLSPKGKWSTYVLAGLFAGLAVGSKPIAWPIAGLIPLFHLVSQPPQALTTRLRSLIAPRLIVATLTTAATALLCLPQIWLDTKDTLAFWKMTAAAGNGGGFDRFALDPGGPFVVYADALSWGIGWAALILCVLGLGWSIVKCTEDSRPLIVAAFPIVYFGFLFRPNLFYFTRYAILAIPLLLLFSAAALWHLTGRLDPRTRTRAFVLLTLLVALQPALSSFRFDYLLTRPDTRTQAKKWVENNIPEGTFIAREGARFSPPLATAQIPSYDSSRTYQVAVKDLYGLSELADAMGAYRGTAKVRQYANAGVQYLITNSINQEMRLLDPQQQEAKDRFYQELAETGTLVAEFSPYKEGVDPKPFRLTNFYAMSTGLWDREFPGPTVRVFRIAPEVSPANDPASNTPEE